MTVGTDYLLVVFIALSICMVLIPLLVRAAPLLGLMDRPDSRKVHAAPVPRVGGLAIVIGALVAMLIWLPLDRLSQSYLIGVAVLVALGVWDDIKEIGHYKKFAGQLIAVLIVVLYGDLYVTRLPFGWETVPAGFGIAFTIFAMVGMINAINHSDGLDGLAGGESLLSLVAIAYLAHLSGHIGAVIIAMTMVGGVLGFLRFNTFPARIFMGDAGSQVLGFTLGFLAVLLTQKINPAVSAAVPVLLLGLPISDILAVFYLRIRHGMNWFRASRNHIHHRLLDRGFAHHESVVVIYSIQAVLVVTAVVLRYESDGLLLALYVAIVSAVFLALTIAERHDWHAHGRRQTSAFFRAIGTLKDDPRLTAWPLAALRCVIPGSMIFISATAGEFPSDMGVAATVLFAVLLLELSFGNRSTSIVVRGIVYVTAVFTMYLVVVCTPKLLHEHDWWMAVFFGIIVIAITFTIRFSKDEIFKLTPLDYLIVCAVIGVVIVDNKRLFLDDIGVIAIQAIVLVYGCELLLSAARRRMTVLNVASLISMGIISVRGLVL